MTSESIPSGASILPSCEWFAFQQAMCFLARASYWAAAGYVTSWIFHNLRNRRNLRMINDFRASDFRLQTSDCLASAFNLRSSAWSSHRRASPAVPFAPFTPFALFAPRAVGAHICVHLRHLRIKAFLGSMVLTLPKPQAPSPVLLPWFGCFLQPSDFGRLFCVLCGPCGLRVSKVLQFLQCPSDFRLRTVLLRPSAFSLQPSVCSVETPDRHA